MKSKKLLLLTISSLFLLSSLVGCGNKQTAAPKEEEIKEGPFTVVWNNYDGKLLERDVSQKKNDLPSYDGNTPVHLQDDNNYYVFKGWDKDLAPLTDDITFTAQYDAFPLTNVDETPDGYVDALPTNTDEGNIFHAFCWTYNEIKERLNDINNAGFKSIQIMPVQQPKSGGASWWAYYQPLSFSIATNSKLGTKAELQSLCTEAESLGISIIADIVFNHLANISDNDLESDGTPKVSPQVEAYEPEIYADRNDPTNPTFHHNKQSGTITQYYPYGALPDLNTANALVQSRALDLLKECIDVGIDGFRFDAAKHIETPNDAKYPSDFWPNTLGAAKTYYFNKTGKELFAYGEILNEVGDNRPLSNYTQFMAVTDNSFGGAIYDGLAGDAKRATGNYHKQTDADNLVTWIESHDTYADSKTHFANDKILMGYAMIATRKDARSLYLSRPDGNLTIGTVGDFTYESNVLGAINRFHNRFHDIEDNLTSKNSIFVNQKVSGNDKGAVIVDLKPGQYISLNLDKLGTGVYYDQITGESYVVRNGFLNIKMPNSGVVILTQSKNLPRPTIEISNRGGSFLDSLNVTITANNGNGQYFINNDSTAHNFTGTITLDLASLIDSDGKVSLKVVVSNGSVTITRTYNYKKIQLIAGAFNVLNIKPDYLANNQIWMWSWKANQGGKWSQDFTVQDGVLLVDVDTLKPAGFILGVFPVGYTITNPNSWDDKCFSQTGDISGDILAQGYYDASSL